MKIILLVAGSGGGFYCETCLRDTDWARVMRARGHDVIATPMYLPVNMEGVIGDDRRFIEQLEQRLADAGMAEAAEFLPGVDRESRIALLETLTVMSVPMPAGEAFGAFIIEALAAGVPVVLPAAGAFPEVVQATGGGITYAPNTPETLARALTDLLGDRAKAAAIGQQGMESVRRHFTVTRMADELETLFTAAIAACR